MFGLRQRGSEMELLSNLIREQICPTLSSPPSRTSAIANFLNTTKTEFSYIFLAFLKSICSPMFFVFFYGEILNEFLKLVKM